MSVTAIAPVAAPATATTAPTSAVEQPAALTPVQKIAERFIGQEAFKLDFGEFGQTHTFIQGQFGAKNGYESLDTAIKLARSEAIENYKPDFEHPQNTTGQAFVVMKAGDRYAMMQPDHVLLFGGRTHLWEARGYHPFGTDTGAAIAAVIDGAGNVLPNLGTSHWWN